jgi:hypothetical protein
MLIARPMVTTGRGSGVVGYYFPGPCVKSAEGNRRRPSGKYPSRSTFSRRTHHRSSRHPQKATRIVGCLCRLPQRDGTAGGSIAHCGLALSYWRSSWYPTEVRTGPNKGKTGAGTTAFGHGSVFPTLADVSAALAPQGRRVVEPAASKRAMRGFCARSHED